MAQQTDVLIFLKVHPVVFEYYKSMYGLVIDLDRNNTLSHRIAYLLTSTRPKDYNVYKLKSFKILQLRLHHFNINNTRINIQYRNYLDDSSQYQISKELYNRFKDIFHAHVLAYCRAGGMQSDGIKDFCDAYRIYGDVINFDMLKKSWDRSDEKKILKNVNNRPFFNTNTSPVLF